MYPWLLFLRLSVLSVHHWRQIGRVSFCLWRCFWPMRITVFRLHCLHRVQRLSCPWCCAVCMSVGHMSCAMTELVLLPFVVFSPDGPKQPHITWGLDPHGKRHFFIFWVSSLSHCSTTFYLNSLTTCRLLLSHRHLVLCCAILPMVTEHITDKRAFG